MTEIDTDLYPDTSISYVNRGHVIGRDPIALLPGYVVGNGHNTQIPAKGVSPVGPQMDRTRVRHNLGSVIVPGIRRYLEQAGQKQVGVLPRVLPSNVLETWDTPYALNPSVEVI